MLKNNYIKCSVLEQIKNILLYRKETIEITINFELQLTLSN